MYPACQAECKGAGILAYGSFAFMAMNNVGANSLLRRYMDGQYQQVWAALLDLGAAVRGEQYSADAEGVAHETMKRARHNVELLIRRLDELGYRFYAPAEEGIQWLGPTGPRTSTRDFLRYMPPDRDTPQELADIERCFGILPLSLRAWYEIVGGVEFRGDHPTLAGFLGARPTVDGREIYPDPLVTFPPIFHFNSWGAKGERLRSGEVRLQSDSENPTLLEVSADLHSKAGYGGGLNFQIQVPEPRADAPLLRESHKTTFLEYIRLSFRWGGFPGWESYQERPEKELAYLREGILPI
jgi:hypothetical protein